MNVDVNKLKYLYEQTCKTDAQIADELGISITWLYRGFLYKMYDRDYRKTRKQRSYQLSKQGDKNPMKGKFGESHPRYKERVSDGKGYMMVLKPDWYTGRKGSHHVFEHSVVMCKALGIQKYLKVLLYIILMGILQTTTSVILLLCRWALILNYINSYESAETRARARRGTYVP